MKIQETPRPVNKKFVATVNSQIFYYNYFPEFSVQLRYSFFVRIVLFSALATHINFNVGHKFYFPPRLIHYSRNDLAGIFVPIRFRILFVRSTYTRNVSFSFSLFLFASVSEHSWKTLTYARNCHHCAIQAERPTSPSSLPLIISAIFTLLQTHYDN